MLLSPISDGAVLQREMPLPLRGRAEAGAAVAVAFRGQRWETVADETGAWHVVIGPFAAGGPDTQIITAGKARHVVTNLLIGEVWVCSGQSNMEFPLRRAEGGEEEIARAALPGVRLLRLPGTVTETPQSCLPDARWQDCAPETAEAFSAVGYYFGKHLRAALGVPVGLIQAAVGNTPGESWMPMPALEADPLYGPIFERWRRSLAIYPDPEGLYARDFAAWDRAADQAEREGRPIPGAFPKLIGPGHPWTPAGLFNGMIAPLTALPVRGVLWMQGAAAPERAHQYRALFRALIRAWRAAWGIGDFPFLFAQEASFGPRRAEPCEHSWAELREAQAMGLAEPATSMVVALDCGEEADIHPRRKAPLGERFALAARAIAYGEAVPHRGPTLDEMIVEGRRVRLRFRDTHGGLRTADDGPPRGFAVTAGASDFSAGHRGYVWAQAEIDGDDVVVWSDDVPRPVAVRYAWAQFPDANLVNAAGLPAAPFRTDDYPGVTVENR